MSTLERVGVETKRLTGGAAEKNQSQGAKGDDLGSLHYVGCLRPAERPFLSGNGDIKRDETS